MPKHQIIKSYTEHDAVGKKVYVIVCKCNWKEKGYDATALRGTYQHHVITDHRPKKESNA